ncbi:unnamed protein product [Cyprideis torosa]|uniref:Uncharacterized protein n=1 Tax=Cyprideis torosa TaxID=163714 RepID=A0A7R8WV05_9CRUS|nr:unnamed protein product [Cyprideis torosa]CAG0907261.1 unnamed protein product [Cyprideis torosa]
MENQRRVCVTSLICRLLVISIFLSAVAFHCVQSRAGPALGQTCKTDEDCQEWCAWCDHCYCTGGQCGVTHINCNGG